eukprot:g9281.t1
MAKVNPESDKGIHFQRVEKQLNDKSGLFNWVKSQFNAWKRKDDLLMEIQLLEFFEGRMKDYFTTLKEDRRTDFFFTVCKTMNTEFHRSNFYIKSLLFDLHDAIEKEIELKHKVKFPPITEVYEEFSKEKTYRELYDKFWNPKCFNYGPYETERFEDDVKQNADGEKFPVGKLPEFSLFYWWLWSHSLRHSNCSSEKKNHKKGVGENILRCYNKALAVQLRRGYDVKDTFTYEILPNFIFKLSQLQGRKKAQLSVGETMERRGLAIFASGAFFVINFLFSLIVSRFFPEISLQI